MAVTQTQREKATGKSCLFLIYFTLTTFPRPWSGETTEYLRGVDVAKRVAPKM